VPSTYSDRLVQSAAARFRVLDRSNGRIALQSLAGVVKRVDIMSEVRIEKEEKRYVFLFQWQDMLRGDLILMSLVTHRHLLTDPNARSLS